jgi:outer membrane protein TolC
MCGNCHCQHFLDAERTRIDGWRRATLFELTAVLGRTPAQAPNDLTTCIMPLHLTALIPVGDGAELIKRRPDVRQAERRLAAATADIGVATADLYPTIRLVGLHGDAQDKLHTAFGIAHDQLRAGALSNLDLLTTEQSLVAIDAAVASSDAALVQDQIAVFKALGGGWRRESQPVRLSE